MGSHPHAGPRRSWLFVDGADERALNAATDSGADVLIQELEDFTPPALRPAAREMSPGILDRWRAAGALAAVRVNPLEQDGLVDLEAVMVGRPGAVLLPKANEPAQIERLDREITRLEHAHRLPAGSTVIVPNIELAAGLVNTVAIAGASPRVSACLVASEDMAADLGAERTREGSELAYVRSRFHLECTAAGVLAVDCPYTWTDEEGLRSDIRFARRLGYRAKSAVHLAHAAVINEALTPAAADVERARRIVEAFDRVRARGEARVEHEGSLIEVPIYLNAKRLLARAAELSPGGPGSGGDDSDRG